MAIEAGSQVTRPGMPERLPFLPPARDRLEAGVSGPSAVAGTLLPRHHRAWEGGPASKERKVSH